MLVSRVVVPAFIVALIFPVTVWAWGGKGHKAVADLAEANLRPEVLAQVNELLKDDLDRHGRPSGRKTLGEVASWPDEIRVEARRSDPAAYRGWHVRANPVCSTRLHKCPAGHCVDQLIIHYSQILKDRSLSHRERNEALKWVVHLVGDLHQPLHSGVNSDGGGMPVILDGVALKSGEHRTLHSVWDKELAVAALRGWKPHVSLPPVEPPLEDDAPTQWMVETRDVALRDVYEPLKGFQCGERLDAPIILDAAYQQRSVAVVRLQIERAGLRLARLLNEVLAVPRRPSQDT